VTANQAALRHCGENTVSPVRASLRTPRSQAPRPGLTVSDSMGPEVRGTATRASAAATNPIPNRWAWVRRQGTTTHPVSLTPRRFVGGQPSSRAGAQHAAPYIYRRPRAVAERRYEPRKDGSGRVAEGAMAESSGSGSVSVDVERISFGGKVRRHVALFVLPFQMEMSFPLWLLILGRTALFFCTG
jgi:hypothetical protein